MRNKILKILQEYRYTEIGNIALANIISFRLKGLNNLTNEPLAILFSENGEKSYKEVGNICQITPTNIKIGEKVFEEVNIEV